MKPSDDNLQFPFDYDQVFILEEWMIRSNLQARDLEKYSSKPDLEAVEFYNDAVEILTSEATFIRETLFENQSVRNAYSKATLQQKSDNDYQLMIRCWPPPCVVEDKEAIQSKGARAAVTFIARPILNIDPARKVTCQLISRSRGTVDRVLVNYTETIQSIKGNYFSILLPKISNLKGVKKARLVIKTNKFNTRYSYSYDFTLI